MVHMVVARRTLCRGRTVGAAPPPHRREVCAAASAVAAGRVGGGACGRPLAALCCRSRLPPRNAIPAVAVVAAPAAVAHAATLGLPFVFSATIQPPNRRVHPSLPPLFLVVPPSLCTPVRPHPAIRLTSSHSRVLAHPPECSFTCACILRYAQPRPSCIVLHPAHPYVYPMSAKSAARVGRDITTLCP